MQARGMDQRYRHTQLGVVTLATIGPTAGLALVLAAFAEAGPERTVLVVSAVFLAGLAVLFASLRVTISDGTIEARFGPGPIRRRIELSEVRSAKVVRTRWWHGWGIRSVPKGWMFNVSGWHAVELELASGRVFRIGTDEPDALLRALRRAGVGGT